MGDFADDAFDAAMKEEDTRWYLRQACERKPEMPCDWSVNDDGLYECKKCGVVTDI